MPLEFINRAVSQPSSSPAEQFSSQAALAKSLMNPRNPDERLTDLETSLAHQQHLCDQLNQVVTSQTRQIISLERIVVRLEKEVKELREHRKDSRSEMPADERPPHY